MFCVLCFGQGHGIAEVAMDEQVGDSLGFFLSWDEVDNGDISGCMVVDACSIDPLNSDSEDLTDISVGFDYTDAAKVADMFLHFDDGNAWADGLCVEVTKDITASSLGQVFAARGLMEMKAQFMRVDDITVLPQLHMHTISDTWEMVLLWPNLLM